MRTLKEEPAVGPETGQAAGRPTDKTPSRAAEQPANEPSTRAAGHVLRDEASRKDLLHRLRRAEGQLRGVQRMISEDADCMQIAQQIAAVRRALDSAYVRMTVCFMEQELSSRIAQASEDPVDLSDLLGNIESLLARVR